MSRQVLLELGPGLPRGALEAGGRQCGRSVQLPILGSELGPQLLASQEGSPGNPLSLKLPRTRR